MTTGSTRRAGATRSKAKPKLICRRGRFDRSIDQSEENTAAGRRQMPLFRPSLPRRVSELTRYSERISADRSWKMYADRKAPYPETITAPLISLRSRCHWSRSRATPWFTAEPRARPREVYRVASFIFLLFCSFLSRKLRFPSPPSIFSCRGGRVSPRGFLSRRPDRFSLSCLVFAPPPPAKKKRITLVGRNVALRRHFYGRFHRSCSGGGLVSRRRVATERKRKKKGERMRERDIRWQR